MSAGIPFRAESSSLVYASRAVRDLLMVLRAVDDPTNYLHIVSALRTPLLGMRRRRPLPVQGSKATAGGATWPTSPSPCPSTTRFEGGSVYLRSLYDQRQLAGALRAARAHRPRPAGARARIHRGEASRRLAAAPVRHRPGSGLERRDRRQPAPVPGLGEAAGCRGGTSRRGGPARDRRRRGANHDDPQRQGSASSRSPSSRARRRCQLDAERRPKWCSLRAVSSATGSGRTSPPMSTRTGSRSTSR